MTEGGLPSPVIIDIPIDDYWEDGSFIEIPFPIPSAKVRYIGYEEQINKIESIHSAVVETGDIVVSKWGSGGALVRHHKDDSRYDSSNLKYYKRNTPIVITGPDSTPSNTNLTYSVTTTAQGVTFNNWSITGGSYTITSGGTNNPSSLNV